VAIATLAVAALACRFWRVQLQGARRKRHL
jgi:hypothetical protein